MTEARSGRDNRPEKRFQVNRIIIRYTTYPDLSRILLWQNTEFRENQTGDRVKCFFFFFDITLNLIWRDR